MKDVVTVQWLLLHLHSVGNSSLHQVELPRYEHSSSTILCARKIERDL